MSTTRPYPSFWHRLLRSILTQRIVLLSILIVVLVAVMFTLSVNNYLVAPYNAGYVASALIDLAPSCMLGLAELMVIVSGRGGIDLSLGSIVSLTGMIFGLGYGEWGLPIFASVILAVLMGGLLGAINGYLAAYFGFPPLITTLATYYAYQSLALVINGNHPISTPRIQRLYSITDEVTIPFLGTGFPALPLGLFTFMIPVILVTWVLLKRSTYGRRLYGIGTNDIAAHWSGINVAATRMIAFVIAGATSGLVSVYLVAQFASARPNAGSAGNGLALPAITVAVLGGVAITGGVGRVSGVFLAALLITLINSGILLYFTGNEGTQFQLLALGSVLIFAAMLNGITSRSYEGNK